MSTKAAIAVGRTEAAVVRAYLEAVEARRPKRERQASPERMTDRLPEIEAQLVEKGSKPIERLRLLQDSRNIENALEALRSQPDLAAAETGFIVHATNYRRRKRIESATWREFEVATDLLARAGFARRQ